MGLETTATGPEKASVKRYSALVCMLYVGEPSLEMAIRSVEAQQRVNFRLIIIGHYPEREAHVELFRTLNRHSSAFDVMTFLGSDMRLLEPNYLYALAHMYAQHPQIGRTLFGVDDWISGERILGAESWRRGTRLGTAKNSHFPDVVRSSAQRKLKLADPGRPLIMHAEDPDDSQAVRYGLHRGAKAVAARSINRWRHIQAFSRFVMKDPMPQRLLALAALERALLDQKFAAHGLSTQSGAPPADVEDLRGRSVDGDLPGRVISLAEEGIAKLNTAEPDGPTAPQVTSRFRSLTARVQGRLMRTDDSKAQIAEARREFFAALDDK